MGAALKPRYYQTAAVDAIYNYFIAGNTGNPVVAMPTGTGKSIVIGVFVHSIFTTYSGQRVMMLTHVKELIDQNYDKLKRYWPQAPAGIYSAGLKRKEHYFPITFAGIGSVAKKAHLFGHIDIVLIDEAHRVSNDEKSQYRSFINDLKNVNPHLKVIGLTATPWRLGQGKITDEGLFTDICYDLTTMAEFNKLISEGFLCPLVPRSTNTMLDVSNVPIVGGEFVESKLQLAVDKDEVTWAALKEAVDLGHDRNHWVIFASGVKHAENINRMLNNLGVSSTVVHSEMDGSERDANIEGFKSGKYRAIVNNNILTTGFDYPDIDLIVVLRPTNSSILWVQMLGRGTRPLYAGGYDLETIEGRLMAIAASAKQNTLVLDFARNTPRLGPINDPVIPRKKGEKTGDAPVKICDTCGTYNHASVTNCVVCGAEFKFEVKIRKLASTQELIKNDAPVVEVFKISHLSYNWHEKVGAEGPMIRISYYCGLRRFQEFICPQHTGYPYRKAVQLWRERSLGEALPATTQQAFDAVNGLRVPTHLRVWVNKPFPEILAHCFEGTAFGTEIAQTTVPEIQVIPQGVAFNGLLSKPTKKPALTLEEQKLEDDLPF